MIIAIAQHVLRFFHALLSGLMVPFDRFGQILVVPPPIEITIRQMKLCTDITLFGSLAVPFNSFGYPQINDFFILIQK